MANAQQDSEAFQELQFSLNGLDVSEGFEGQRSGTTRTGINVRACEPDTFRLRGGSRAGLSKYVSEILPTDANSSQVIQHLAVIVDPQTDALLADLDQAQFDFDDPSTSNRKQRVPIGGRKVRRGGSGRQTSHRTPKPTLTVTASNQTKQHGETFTFAGSEFTLSGLEASDSVTRAAMSSTGAPASAANGTYAIRIRGLQGQWLSAAGLVPNLGQKYKIVYVNGTMTVDTGIQFEQANSTSDVNGILTLAFSHAVTTGNLLIFCTNGFSNLSSVSDSLGNTYTLAKRQLGSTARTEVWYAISAATGACTVTGVSTGSSVCLAVAEYSIVAQVGVLDSTASAGQNTSIEPITSGSVSVNDVNEMILGVVGQWEFDSGASGDLTITPGASYTKRTETQVFDSVNLYNFALTIMDHIGVDVAEAVTATTAFSGTFGLRSACIGASFKPQ